MLSAVKNDSITYACLERQFQHEKEELISKQLEVMASGQYILGDIVETLEREIAEFCGVKYCVTLNSGTDALILGMKALGIGDGDEVITPTNSFIASAASIAHLGAVPVLTDVSSDQNIDVRLIESKISKKTKAIMPVHLTGRIAQIDEIKAIAKKHNLFIIEDAAQSFGAKYKDQLSGSMGDIGCFSAHPLKVFNACGDAGFLTTNKKEIYDEVCLLRAHGLRDRNTVLKWGYVSRLDAIQASILLVRLTKIKQYIEKRRQHANLYKKLLDPSFVFIPPCHEHEYHSYQTFVIQVNHRDMLQTYLENEGIPTSIHYPVPIHLQPAAKDLGWNKGDMLVSEKQAKRILSLPVSQFLETTEIELISSKINQFFIEESYVRS